MSMSTMKTRDWLAACAPPQRRLDLRTSATPGSSPSELFLERADEHHFRALRHIHALPLPQLLRGALNYASHRSQADVAEYPARPGHHSIRSGGELVASVREVVANASRAVQPVEIKARCGVLRDGWVLFVHGRELMLAVAPPAEFGAEDMREFVAMRQYRCTSWESDADRPFTTAERLWATLYDGASKDRQSPKFFILSTYNEWIFGGFSEHLTTAWVSQPLAYDSHTPNVPETIAYWLASSSGAPGAYKIPAVAERPPRVAVLPRILANLHKGALRDPQPLSAAPAIHLLEKRYGFNDHLAALGQPAVPEPGSWAAPDSPSWASDDELELDRSEAAGNMLARLGMRLHRCPAKSVPPSGGGTLLAELERAVVGVTMMMEDFAMSCEPFRMDDDDDDEEGFTLKVVDFDGPDEY
ncbi:hypothetical protein AURDEDRAFT_173263 [Auricularia subglabra TFB-10046 SS5]|uniref:Uncharacterized protein n=1 Tax=Auricularia subglabra (strain TFB-10046 / SS5) TaxID=717982 RepID=J0LHW8_AURST|nr:hypothetical protein AURDEDRAFT_173263 [Auricularia subglabra TFB-10046 SS5]